jgi:hypothetical protein
MHELLDAMLLGWLERQADTRAPGPPGRRETVSLVLGDHALLEIQRIGAAWAVTVGRPGRGMLAILEGPARVVEAFTAIMPMWASHDYRSASSLPR